MKGLGQKIKSLRKEQRLTIVEMAKKTGIDQATLSRMENEKMTGTLDSHMRIAQALGMRLPDLYESVAKDLGAARDKTVQKKLETFSHSSGAIAELLTTSVLQKKMMPVLLKIKPGGHTETEEYSSSSERFIYLLKGSLVILLGDEEKPLKEKESLYFNASQSHSFKNSSKNEARLLSVLTPASL